MFHWKKFSLSERYKKVEKSLRLSRFTSYGRGVRYMAKTLWGMEEYTLSEVEAAQKKLEVQ